MNTPGTRPPLQQSTPRNAGTTLRPPQGFSLVEVLITALLIGIGLMGMAALQGQAVSHTAQAERRSTAAMLASDLLELIRAAPANWNSYLSSGPPSPAPATLCTTTPANPDAQLACWLAEVDALLPQPDARNEKRSHVCRSPTPGTCSTTGTVLEVQVAWKASHGECTDTLCHFRLRGEI